MRGGETRARRALVTGASGAIGAAIAAALERQGALVLRHGCSNRGDGFLRADLRIEAEIEALFLQAEERLGPIDILVNNAGAALPQQLITDTSAEQFDGLFALDARAVFLCCRRALPGMVRRTWGRIVHLSPAWGAAGGRCEVAYSAAKAAVVGLTKALAKEAAPSGVTVNCVAPGAVDTPMNAHLSPEELSALAREIPAGRLGAPEDVAEAVCFFAGEGAGYVTGQVLCVDGGFI
ncbi:MAG: SDR family oxidoreductase [Oscillospiraceae bacterium]|jgi:3-oxoacyl-[acyl-carrier protein] reductase|nr:SDR family oxidoreductase [Oscillospiraceae bacterium]